MKKIEDLFFTVTKIFCSKIRADALFLSTAQKRNLVHVRHTFVCRADDIFEKSVKIRADAFRAVDPDSYKNLIS